MGTMVKNPDGEHLIHEDTLDGKKVLTTWADTKAAADQYAEDFRTQGAGFTRVFSGGSVLGKYRIIGHW